MLTELTGYVNHNQRETTEKLMPKDECFVNGKKKNNGFANYYRLSSDNENPRKRF